MADNQLIITASLNIPETVNTIKNDLKKVADQLNSADALKIKCSIDTSNIKAIKSQLSGLSKNLKINLFSDAEGGTVKNVTNDIVKEFNKAFNMIGKMGDQTKRAFNTQTKEMLQEFKTAWEHGMETGDFSPYTKALDKLEQRIREFNKGDVQQLKALITELRSSFTDGSKVSIGSNLKGWLDKATGNNDLSRKYLDAIYGANNYTIGAGNAGYDTLFTREEDAVESIISAATKIIEYQNKIKSTGWGIDELEEMGVKSEEISNNIEDNLRKIVGLPEKVKVSTDGWFDIDASDDVASLNQLTVAVEDYSEAESKAAEQSEILHRRQELLQQDYERTEARLKKVGLDINEVSTRKESTGEIVNYNEKLNELLSDDITDWNTLSKARDYLAAINKEYSILNTKAEASIPQTALENFIQKIAKTDSQIKVLRLDYEKLTNIPDDLLKSYGKLLDSIAGFKFDTNFRSLSKEDFDSMVEQYTDIRVALNDTQSLLKVAQKEESDLNKEAEKYEKNLLNHQKEVEKLLDLKEKEIQKAKELNKQEQESAAKKEQINALKEIANAYQKIQQYSKVVLSPSASQGEKETAQSYLTQYRQIITATVERLNKEGLLTKEIQDQISSYEGALTEVKAMVSAKAEAVEVQKKENEAIQEAAKLERDKKEQEKKDSALITLDNRIKSITADMNEFGIKYAEILKSTAQTGNGKTFADTWSDLYSRIINGANLTESELKHLREEFVLFAKTVKAESDKINQTLKDDETKKTLENRISKASAALEDYARKNKKVANSTKTMSDGTYTFAEKLKELRDRLNGLKNNPSSDEFRHLNEEIATFKKEADAAGLTINAFFRNMRTQLSYVIMQWVSIQGAIRIIRSLAQEVTEVDTAMTELRKVTEATNEEFEAFAVSAGKTGRELGASVSDVINATAEFARLGETLPDAEELGRVATLYKNVGDGIDITTASEDIISTMKAFKIEASDAVTIVDKLNEVGNNFAISSGGIGEALKRSASALAAGNNDLSESIALITTANTIAQDPTTVGQGIKTVSLRLRSTKTELEELGEDAEGAAENVSKLRDQMLALTGVDIQLDDSTYKSTYQILLEISKVWGRLDDLSRSSVLEQLFGKRQANIGAAILENGDLLERVYQTSEKASDGIGSAMREQEEYAKSIQYSIDTLKAAYQDFADTVINSDFIKDLLSTAQKFLEVLTKIIDEFGALPTILTGIAAIGGVKGVGKPNMPKFVLLQIAQVDTPHQRAFQLLETPKAA